MPIPNETIEHIRATADIVEVIGDYVQLRRTGKNWIGLCPFHDDNKPSFAVEPVRGIYKCFACGKGGDVFTFLMENNHWSFPETVRFLGSKCRIEVPGHGEEEREEYSEREQCLAVIREATLYYYRTLTSDTESIGREYFQERGFTNETITKFGLGYAADDWEGVINHLVGKGYTHEAIEQAGLSVKREGKSGWYDRFRGRVLFPVFTVYGKVAGFGARVIDSADSQHRDTPKYLNSPETSIYQKSKLLYGLYQAKEALRKSKRALLVEGYSDVITLHQAGVEVAVATCGTAVTQDHAAALARFVPSVVVMFDGDRSGNAASYRGINVLLKQGLDVFVLRLPSDEDPDSFVRNHGITAFERKMEESVRFLDFRIHEYHRSGEFDTVERKVVAIRELVKTVAQIPDTMKQELLAQQIAASSCISEKEVMKELQQARNAKQQPAHVHKIIQQADYPSAEFRLLGVLLEGDRAMFASVLSEIDPSDFTNPVCRQCLEFLLERYCDDAPFAVEKMMLVTMDAQLRELLTLLTVPRQEVSSKWTTIDPEVRTPNKRIIAKQCVQYFQEQRLRHEQEEIKSRMQILEAGCGGDQYEVQMVALFEAAAENNRKMTNLRKEREQV